VRLDHLLSKEKLYVYTLIFYKCEKGL